MYRSARLSGLIAGVLVTLAFSSGTAAAITFTASLNPIKLNAKPGQVLTTEFRLTSQPGEPRAQFKVEIQDWWRSEDGRQSFYGAAGSLPRSCGRWTSVNPGEAAIVGGETLVVRLTVSVPVTAEPGGYWCALTVDEVPDPLAATPDQVAMRFLASLATGIYVYIDPVERAAKIQSIELESDEAIVQVENSGNTPVAVEGRFEFFRQGEKEPVAVAVLPRNMLLTTPVATGRFAAVLPAADVLPSGHYLVRALVDIGLDHYIGVQREIELRRTETAGR
ncbi:hypothetical protein BH24ACI4_BH24ACI4_10390 [soil metagenome]